MTYCWGKLRLQKFKMNIANSVVNQDNSSLRSMDTNQLLDLFDLQSDQSTEKAGKDFTNPNQPLHSQDTEEFISLWDDTQYTEEYNLDQFVSSLRK